MSTISASTTSSTAYKVTADTTGALVLQTGATPTTAVTIDTSQNTTLAGTLTTSSRGIAKASMPAGSVLQVVSTTKTDTFSTASTSYVDVTGLSVSITPTASTSKILIQFSIVAGSQGIFAAQLVRGSTVIGVGDLVGSHTQASIASFTNSDANTTAIGAFNYLDSPATTSATTYKIQVITQGSTNYVNRTINDVNSIVGTRSASSITVMEIAA